MGQTSIENNTLTLYRTRSNIEPAQIFPFFFFTPTAKARPDQAALATSAEGGSHTPSTASESLSHPPTLSRRRRVGEEKGTKESAAANKRLVYSLARLSI